MRLGEAVKVDTAHGRVAVRGAGDGSPVVLLHGVFGAARVWEPVAERLARTHRVLAPDLLGFGDSERPIDADALWAPHQAEAVLAALDALGVGRFALVGYDYGGPVAAHLHELAPERVTHLALTATNAFPDAPVPFPLSLVRRPVVGDIAAALLFSGPGLWFAARGGVGDHALRLDRTLVLGDRAQQRAVRALFTAAMRELAERYRPVRDALAEVRVPTLVAWGDRDPFFPLEQGRKTAALIPGARLVVHEGAGHFVPEERPARFAEDLLDLLTVETVR